MNGAEDLRPGQRLLEKKVEEQVRRIRQAKRDRRTLMGQTVFLGSIGIMVALPIVAGAYLGQWLDSLSPEYGVHWTISMIFLGIVVGAVNLYLFLKE